MNKLFYPKLAATNIKKNGKTYIPYILTCTLTAAMFYIIRSLSLNEGLERMSGADTLTYTMGLGSWVVGIFAVIFLFYTNSFLMKRRKKEFGLFNILGMEKKHLSRVIGLETVYIAGISLAAGLVLGVLLDKLLYLAILKWLDAPVPLGFYISWQAVVTTLLLFAAIFLLIYLNSLRQIRLANPIELLRGGSVGEKEPKTKWVMALLGAASLGTGYYLAVTTKEPASAVLVFFLAVILVIIGTYMLFTAGSIALLKILRRRKKYYYSPKHFTSVSGLIYRMKQNAVGLANICILSTMVLVMIASTSSLMLGMEDIISARYPYDMLFYASEPTAPLQDELAARTDRLLAGRQVEKRNETAYRYLSFAARQMGTVFSTDREANSAANLELLDSVKNLFFVPLEDYNRTSGQQYTLEEGEVLVYSDRQPYTGDVLQVDGMRFTVAQQLPAFLGNGIMRANAVSSYYIVVRDMETIHELDALQEAAYGKNASDVGFCYGFDMDADRDTQKAVYKDLVEDLKAHEFEGLVESKADSRESFMSLYGGFFFIGVFLGSLFIMATILIIYYKQISEGYEDKERYAIMQKVGMSHGEVKKSIHSQILTVFFLPLITAGVHTAFSFPIMSKILAMFNLTNTTLFVLCTLGCFLVFALLYSLIYGLTAKAYYRIVSR